VQEAIKEYYSTYIATNDNKVLDKFLTKLINNLENFIEKITKDSTLYYLAKICNIYENFNSKNT
ncbi:6832_t:CDS:1, partial [Racocetra persica]